MYHNCILYHIIITYCECILLTLLRCYYLDATPETDIKPEDIRTVKSVDESEITIETSISDGECSMLNNKYKSTDL